MLPYHCSDSAPKSYRPLQGVVEQFVRQTPGASHLLGTVLGAGELGGAVLHLDHTVNAVITVHRAKYSHAQTGTKREQETCPPSVVSVNVNIPVARFLNMLLLRETGSEYVDPLCIISYKQCEPTIISKKG